jgi:ATP-dependent protease ClpP protease subunit
MARTGQVTVVRLYDEIGGGWGVSASDLLRELDAAPGDVELRINSPGGDLHDGIAVYSALRQRRRGQVSVYVDGLAASIASVVAMGASPGQLVAAEGSLCMVHDAWAVCTGAAADMRETASVLNKASDNIASIYARRTGLPAAFWRAAMKAETWYTADEAVAAGFVDRVAS